MITGAEASMPYPKITLEKEATHSKSAKLKGVWRLYTVQHSTSPSLTPLDYWVRNCVFVIYATVILNFLVLAPNLISDPRKP